LRGGIIGYLIGLAFAFYWLNVGTAAVGGTAGSIIFVFGGLVLLAALWRVGANRDRPTSSGRFVWGWYVAAVIAEIIALNVVVLTLSKSYRVAYQAPVIGTIVGLHFIGLWLATRMPRFLSLSATMTALNLVALALPATHAPAVLAGLGSASLLAVTVAA
jgi:ABC-type iron transport system FetAB permease component